MSRWTPTAAVALLAAASCGCKPTIDSFVAAPNVICRGSAARLTWAASADGALTSNPPLAGLGDVPSSGSRDVSPTQPTRFQLRSSNVFGDAAREVDIDVRATPDEAKTLGGSVADPSATCSSESGLALTVTAPDAMWDEHLRVGDVAIGAGVTRPYHVEHEGHAADLQPGVRSAAFRGSAVRGTWKLSTPLQPGESCGPSLPRSLLIDVFAMCVP